MKLRIKWIIWNIRKQKIANQKKKKKKTQKHENSVSSLCDNFKRSNICIILVLEREKEQEIGNVFEKLVKENFPNLVKEMDM